MRTFFSALDAVLSAPPSAQLEHTHREKSEQDRFDEALDDGELDNRFDHRE